MNAEPDLTELIFCTRDVSSAVREALWHSLNTLNAKAKPYKSVEMVVATLSDDEVETFKCKFPTVPTIVNQVIAGQEYPPPAGYRDTITELSKRLLPEWHRGGETCSWQGLVGKHLEVAKAVILAQYPQMIVEDCGQDVYETCDYRIERVRIYTDHKHIVREVPSSG